MLAPKEAFDETSNYIMICGIGFVFVVAYNVLSGIFRGLGDSKTPLITVAVACVFNIIGDLILIAVFDMGAVGAAIATVGAQGMSVIVSILIIRKRDLPFDFSTRYIRYDSLVVKTELKLGIPIALQDLLVGISFLVIQTVVNTMGVIASAGVGVAEKLCIFIMLVPSSYMQSMSAFVAQNIGAGKIKRANKALLYGITTSLSAGIVMACVTILYGDIMASIFTTDEAVIAAAFDYLKAYGIDCLFVAELFCFIGYFNGRGKTLFVMIQGLIGAFCVRVPVVILMSKLPETSLFLVGLATPASTVVQIILCLVMFLAVVRRQDKKHTTL
jgi:putative MATE family efflux protein